MDPNTTASPDLATLKGNANTAVENAGKLQESIPGLLSGLKTNLTSIFSNDNPMFTSRENALQTFLNAPSQTRANMLPANQPIIGGSALNFSPTQQEAQVTAARNAALVPLAGLNQSIVGQYGNLNDLLQNAGSIYNTQAQIAQKKAENAMQLYKDAVAEYKISQMYGGGGGSGDLGTILSALLTRTNQNNQPRPDPAQFDQSDHTPIPAVHPVVIPGQAGTLNLSNTPPPVINNPVIPPLIPDRWNPLTQLGALGRLIFGEGGNTVNPNTSLNILGANNDPNRLYFTGG